VNAALLTGFVSWKIIEFVAFRGAAREEGTGGEDKRDEEERRCRGAEGTAPNGTILEIATIVSTNQGRTFVYLEREMSKGTYKFTVPYSTEGSVEGGTNFDVVASPYYTEGRAGGG
jgi:hypothetical protein